MTPRAILFFALLIVLLPMAEMFGQAESRSKVENEIRQRAEEDFNSGRPAATVESLQILFSEEGRNVGMTVRDVDQVYQGAYHAAEAKARWWRKLQPQAGWIVAGLLFLLVIFRDAVRDGIAEALKALRNLIYARLAGSRWFRKGAIRRYRRAIVRKFEELRIPFRPDRPLEMRRIYVPLKAKSKTEAEQTDIFRALFEHNRLMIVGAPGSGKSMLMRYVALTLAESGLTDPAMLIPILLELNRFNESEASVRDHLVELFRLNDFPNADQFVDIALRQGNLLLLFDGLDEVNSQKRPAAVKRIQDFLEEFGNVSATITCRKAVYHQEFAVSVGATAEIEEFSDDQIWRFLEAWEDEMPQGKSIEQLLQTLRDRPRIMALARNPLLLTIIAYLYCDTEFVLPHSRTEFYEQATDVLLQQWKQERNHFKLAQKRLVLQHLALFNQDRAASATGDRKSIGFRTVIAEVKKLLPDLNLEEKEAQTLVDEIVERSGLLLSIDGGEQYQFAHLTLQEFFAASQLRNTPEALLSRFAQDHSIWLETVKLWCGLENDSTMLIDGVSEHDPVFALECLADAQRLDAAVADRIVAGLKHRVAEAGEIGTSIRRAFAVVASDFRPRGRQVFEFLTGSLRQVGNHELKRAAAEALSYTNLPAAAKELANNADGDPDIRNSLVRMGDLAVGALASASADGFVQAIDDLRTIGTPRAAESLVPLLWNQHELVSRRAAWCLAALMRSESVEAALSRYSLANGQHGGSFSWVWSPFEDVQGPPLSEIAGRIAKLIHETPVEWIPVGNEVLDERIVIPLSIELFDQTLTQRLEAIPDDKVRKLYSSFNIELGESPKPSIVKQKHGDLIRAVETTLETLRSGKASLQEYEPLATTAAEAVSRDEKWRRLASTIRLDIRLPFLLRLLTGPLPTTGDWVNLRKPLKYKFNGSLYQVVTACLVGLITFIAGIELWKTLSGWRFTLALGPYIWYSLMVIGGFAIAGDPSPPTNPSMLLTALLGPVGGFTLGWAEERRSSLGNRLVWALFVGISLAIFAGGWPFISVYFVSVWLLSYFGIPYLMILWVVLFGLITALTMRGLTLDRRARNILHDVFNQSNQLPRATAVPLNLMKLHAKRSLMRLPMKLLGRNR